MKLSHLMREAKKLGNIRMNGTPEEIANAEKIFSSLEKQFLEAPEISLEMTIGELSEVMHGSPKDCTASSGGV